MTRIELVRKVQEVLNQHAEDPAEELIKTGEALIALGKALKGRSRAEAMAIITAAASLM